MSELDTLIARLEDEREELKDCSRLPGNESALDPFTAQRIANTMFQAAEALRKAALSRHESPPPASELTARLDALRAYLISAAHGTDAFAQDIRTIDDAKERLDALTRDNRAMRANPLHKVGADGVEWVWTRADAISALTRAEYAWRHLADDLVRELLALNEDDFYHHPASVRDKIEEAAVRISALTRAAAPFVRWGMPDVQAVLTKCAHDLASGDTEFYFTASEADESGGQREIARITAADFRALAAAADTNITSAPEK